MKKNVQIDFFFLLFFQHFIDQKINYFVYKVLSTSLKKIFSGDSGYLLLV